MQRNSDDDDEDASAANKKSADPFASGTAPPPMKAVAKPKAGLFDDGNR
jgi:hypothetical protein